MNGKDASPHAGHRRRMRARFFAAGLNGFQPHEALELILYCAVPKRDVNPLAHALLDEFRRLGVHIAFIAEVDGTYGVFINDNSGNLIEIFEEGPRNE